MKGCWLAGGDEPAVAMELLRAVMRGGSRRLRSSARWGSGKTVAGRLAALLGTECGSRETCGRGYGPGTAGLGPGEQSAGPEKIAVTPTDVQPRTRHVCATARELG